MTRQWVDDHMKKPRDKRWVMRCDFGDGVRGAQRCTTASEPFEWQPDLAIFAACGWFMPSLRGPLPACVAGRHEGIERLYEPRDRNTAHQGGRTAAQ
jgi:hypothetical protein